MAQNRNFFFERDETFKDLLPITGNVNFLETKYDLSQIECASRCAFCAGFLYNSASGTCHHVKTRLIQESFNTSLVDIGWKFYIRLSGMSKIKKISKSKHLKHIDIFSYLIFFSFSTRWIKLNRFAKYLKTKTEWSNFKESFDHICKWLNEAYKVNLKIKRTKKLSLKKIL